MPMDRKLYPANWNDISKRIRFERAGGCCEWCGVQNNAVGVRDRHGEWHDEDSIHSMNAGMGDDLFGDFPNMTRIILTVAHLGVPKPDGSPGSKHDKMDCRGENLAALCQRCHLNYDRADHIANAKVTWKKKRFVRLETKRREHEAKTGQMSLFEEIAGGSI